MALASRAPRLVYHVTRASGDAGHQGVRLLALATGAIVAALPLIDAKGHHTVGSRVPIAVFILIGVTLATRLLISLTPGARRSE
jgi:hypothetical protein